MEKALLHSSIKFSAVVQELYLSLLLPWYCKYYAIFLPLVLKILHNYPCLREMKKNIIQETLWDLTIGLRWGAVRQLGFSGKNIHCFISLLKVFGLFHSSHFIQRQDELYVLQHHFFWSRGDVVLQHHSQEKKRIPNGFLSDILMWPKQMIVILPNAFWMQCFWE